MEQQPRRDKNTLSEGGLATNDLVSQAEEFAQNEGMTLREPLPSTNLTEQAEEFARTRGMNLRKRIPKGANRSKEERDLHYRKMAAEDREDTVEIEKLDETLAFAKAMRIIEELKEKHLTPDVSRAPTVTTEREKGIEGLKDYLLLKTRSYVAGALAGLTLAFGAFGAEKTAEEMDMKRAMATSTKSAESIDRQAKEISSHETSKRTLGSEMAARAIKDTRSGQNIPVEYHEKESFDEKVITLTPEEKTKIRKIIAKQKGAQLKHMSEEMIEHQRSTFPSALEGANTPNEVERASIRRSMKDEVTRAPLTGGGKELRTALGESTSTTTATSSNTTSNLKRSAAPIGSTGKPSLGQRIKSFFGF